SIPPSVSASEEARETTYDGRIVGIRAIVVELDKVLGQRADVVERVRAQRMSSDLHPLPPGQLLVDGPAESVDTGLQARDFSAKVNHDIIPIDGPHFVELLLLTDERGFKIE